MNDDILIVGRINGFYGLKGYVKVFSETRPRESILNYTELLLFLNGQWQTFVVEAAKTQAKNLVVKFKGLEDRTAVEYLLGCDLAIKRTQLPQAAMGEYYWQDLIGLCVLDQAGATLGEVVSLLETGANDVLVVRGPRHQEVLIPYVLGYTVVNVDLAQRQLIVDWVVDDF